MIASMTGFAAAAQESAQGSLAVELKTVWTDPDFDSSVRAVYYARVLEIPTPRWTAYDAAYFKITIPDPKVPMTTQERAFTSPIWYSPK